MKLLKIISYSLMGLTFGSLMALMQYVLFYMMFISEDSSPMPMFMRIVLYLLLLIITAGWSIESIIKEIKEHNIIKVIEIMERLERE